DAAGDFLRRRALLGDRGGDGAADLADLADDRLNGIDRVDRARGGALHAGDLRRDLLGGAAGFAGARRLDGGIERQQIGLLGDVGDELDDVADARRRLVELLDGDVGAAGLVHRLGGDGVGLRNLTVDFVDGGRQLVGGGGDIADIG